MINKFNDLLRVVSSFNFGLGFGCTIIAATVQVWPFLWSFSITKVERNFDLKLGPIQISAVTS